MSGSKLKVRARTAGEVGADDTGVEGDEKTLETDEREDLEDDRDEVVEVELVRETGDGRCCTLATLGCAGGSVLILLNSGFGRSPFSI